MKRGICVIIVLIILLAISTIELIFVKNTINTLDSDLTKLALAFENTTKNDLSNAYNSVDIAHDNWKKNSNKLCLMYNYNEISVINDSFIKLEIYIKTDNYNDAIAELHLMRNYAEKTHHTMGINIDNIL